MGKTLNTNSTKRFSKSIQAFLLGDYLPRPELRVSKDVVSVGPMGDRVD